MCCYLNSAAMNMEVHVPFQISVLDLKKKFFNIPRSGIAGSISSWEISTLFSTVSTPIFIPTNGVGAFPFLHVLANICYLCPFL